jgi:beta-glucanase (GH16 family)
MMSVIKTNYKIIKIILFAILSSFIFLITTCVNTPQQQSELTQKENPLNTDGSPDVWADPPDGWKKIWEDTFDTPDGSLPDASNWMYDIGGHGWGNSEWEVYTNSVDNAFIQQNKLIIKAIKTTGGRGGFTSARLKTQGLHSWTCEPAKKIAARMKLPFGQGIWPAFWMLGSSISSKGWPWCGEIDIMEMIGGGAGKDDTVYGTAHWNDAGHRMKGGNTRLIKPFYKDYHIFEIEWDASKIVWKLNGKKYFSATVTGKVMDELTDSKNPFFIILNLAVGGTWPGYPASTTQFPQYLVVDWVRVYEKM